MAHTHSHHDFSTQDKINLSFAIAVGANFLFTLVEGGYAIFAHSMSLLADAGHNLGDVFGLGLAWGANWLMTKPAKERYSYGYRRSSVLSAFLNSFLLVATSSIIAYESIVKLINPSNIHEIVVIVVAAIGILVNGATAFLFSKNDQHDLNIKGAFLHLLADALLSLGVLLTAVAIHFTGWQRLDPLIGLVIVAVILWGTWDLLRQSLGLLLDAVPKHIEPEKVSAYLRSLAGVTAIHDLHIWGLSTREVALTAHLIMPETHLSDDDFHHISHELLDQFEIHHVTLQVEKGSGEANCVQEGRC